jgi:GNAT superfamily N-acetyltransferase
LRGYESHPVRRKRREGRSSLPLEFIVGYDLDRFEQYYKTLENLRIFYVSRTGRDPDLQGLGEDERNHIKRDPDHLIVWMDDGELVGHVVWHETSTEEMIPGDPHDDAYKEILRRLFDGKRNDIVELHEVWLQPKHRGKGYGRQFFSFFAEFALERGFNGIVHYTDNPGAIALCRNLGYEEAFHKDDGWFVFTIKLT